MSINEREFEIKIGFIYGLRLILAAKLSRCTCMAWVAIQSRPLIKLKVFSLLAFSTLPHFFKCTYVLVVL